MRAPLTLRLPEATREQIDYLAASDGQSVPQVICALVDRACTARRRRDPKAPTGAAPRRRGRPAGV